MGILAARNRLPGDLRRRQRDHAERTAYLDVAVGPVSQHVWCGLIKLRGDPCWRDLTCLRYYFETQPIPNPLSWYFHRLPARVHRAGVAFNHVVELAVPFLYYFAPQPLAAIGGLLTIAFQLTLIASGNLSWLNWITMPCS
jgi:hypothetical protein